MVKVEYTKIKRISLVVIGDSTGYLIDNTPENKLGFDDAMNHIINPPIKGGGAICKRVTFFKDPQLLVDHLEEKIKRMPIKKQRWSSFYDVVDHLIGEEPEVYKIYFVDPICFLQGAFQVEHFDKDDKNPATRLKGDYSGIHKE